jgi:hypothetical protein
MASDGVRRGADDIRVAAACVWTATRLGSFRVPTLRGDVSVGVATIDKLCVLSDTSLRRSRTASVVPAESVGSMTSARTSSVSPPLPLSVR